MKEKIHEILMELNRGRITVSEAQEQLLDLFGVSGCFTVYDMERAYDDGYSTEGEVNFDIKNYR